MVGAWCWVLGVGCWLLLMAGINGLRGFGNGIPKPHNISILLEVFLPGIRIKLFHMLNNIIRYFS